MNSTDVKTSLDNAIIESLPVNLRPASPETGKGVMADGFMSWNILAILMK